MFINLVLKSLMVTSFEVVCRRATSVCVKIGRGVEMGSTMNIIYGTQNDNLPARRDLGALSMYSYRFSPPSYRW
jgi:hypothetical protein